MSSDLLSALVLVDAITVFVLAGALVAATVAYALALPWRRAEVEVLDGAALAVGRAGMAELRHAAAASRRWWRARPAARPAVRDLADLLG